MPKKEYKRKVAEFFQFKSPTGTAKRLAITSGPEKTDEKALVEPNDETMAIPIQKTGNDIALHSKKRDVIIIGAGLSGKLSNRLILCSVLQPYYHEQLCRLGGNNILRINIAFTGRCLRPR